MKKITIILLIHLILLMLCISCNNATKKSAMFVPWNQIKNPIYAHEGWSIKDVCMTYRDGTFYIFFSAFFFDRGMERSHVVEIATQDWKNFSDPLLLVDGQEDGWTGMCSPDITYNDSLYYLCFNSWGKKHPNGGTNDLFYMTSRDLKNWSSYYPLARSLTNNKTCIDASIIENNDKWYLFWKDDYLDGDKVKFKKMRVAYAAHPDSAFQYIGDGFPGLFQNGIENEPTTEIPENFQIMEIDNRFYLYIDFEGNDQVLFKMAVDSGLNWLQWIDGIPIKIEKESFNTYKTNYAGAISDWRSFDSCFYYIFAGSTTKKGHAGRGDNKIGIARSRDLKTWETP